jgi:1,4-dihydroxy-2-naphthoate polyprenyltransferase
VPPPSETAFCTCGAFVLIRTLNVQQIWWQTIRPRTLPAAVGPVLLGQVLVVEGYFSWVTAVLSVLCALALQIAVNLANDLFDGLSGVDQPDRLGPTRALQSGLLSAAQLRAGLALALGTAIASGLWLIIFGHWILWLLGGLAVLAVLGYSGGRRPYANQGLGELAVWCFFGPVAVLGSLLAQRSPIGAEAVVASILVGLPVAAILVVNNLRDRHGDERAGKYTLAVRMGAGRTRWLFAGLLLAPVLLTLPLKLPGWAWFPWIALLLLAAALGRQAAIRDGHALNPLLGWTALFSLLYALWLALRHAAMSS